MSLEKQLIDRLEKQLDVEIIARDFYKDLMEKIEEGEINKDIKEITDDEIEHISVVEELIKIVENYKKPIQERPGIKSQEELVGENFEKGNVILLLSRVENYMHEIVSILKELIKENKVVYISYNKIPKYTKKILAAHGINPEDMLFINCVAIESKGDINVKPDDLTGISIEITQARKKFKDIVVLVDTLSGFSTYHNVKTISQFVASVNDKARNEDYRILWVAIDDPSESELNSKIAQICDEVVRT